MMISDDLYKIFEKDLKKAFFQRIFSTMHPRTILEIGFEEDDLSEICLKHVPQERYIIGHLEKMSMRTSNTVGTQHVVLSLEKLAFSATFDAIIINFISHLASQSEAVILNLSNCLSTEGRLYFIGFGTCTFPEWYEDNLRCQVPIKLPFLKYPTLKGMVQEEWHQLLNLNPDAITDITQALQERFLKPCFKPFDTKTLSFQVLYGDIPKPSPEEE